MNKDISVKNKKQLIKDFDKAQSGFISSMNKGIGYAFTMGEILIQIKEITLRAQAGSARVE